MRHVLFFTFFIVQFASAQETYKEVFVEEFNNNLNGWQIENSKLRKSQIKDGKLIDWYGEMDFATTNLTTVSFDKSLEYIISVSLANLNNEKGEKYPTYKRKPNGKIKQGWEKNSEWGFVWGFKDWSNYNAFILQTRKSADGVTGFYCRVFTIENGYETVLSDWSRGVHINFIEETDFHDFILVQRATGFSVYIDKPKFVNGKKVADITLLHQVKRYQTTWFDNYIGPFIGAGANVSVDYIRIYNIIPPKKEEGKQP